MRVMVLAALPALAVLLLGGCSEAPTPEKPAKDENSGSPLLVDPTRQAEKREDPVDAIAVSGGQAGDGLDETLGRGLPDAKSRTFFGIRMPAKRIVYIVDRSGSTTDSMMYVKWELRRSVRALSPDDQFNVIFYSSGPAVPMPGGKMVPATEQNKMIAVDFIDSIVPTGQTDPAEALTMAFAEKPQAIYLLTDGHFDAKIPDLIAKLNAKKEVNVHTICFLYSTGEPQLQQIAKDNGGTYKYVGEMDLQTLGQGQL
jgi:hypothetical protein